MAETTISWTATEQPDGTFRPGYTFNPWTGCTRISPGCDHCYAEMMSRRFPALGKWDAGAPRKRTAPATWNAARKWNRAAIAAGRRDRVFCASLADVFDNEAPSEWRADLWRLIAECPALDWLLLTKRPQNISKMLPAYWGNGWPNVWLGTTCENQVEADRRIPHLRAITATVRFLSCEPLIEHVEPDLDGIGWVICGGESGPGARRMRRWWATSLRDQCQAAGVAFFMKQIGSERLFMGPHGVSSEWSHQITGKGADPAQWPEDLRVQQFPTPAHHA